MELVTIIIPVFNGEKFIQKAIQSVQEQTYTNWELLIINDGSTDQTKTIVEDYQKEDLKICLINQENEGVSKARNTGIQMAKGEYITFLDADDYLDIDYIQTLIDTIQKEQTDMVLSGYNKIGNSEKKVYPIIEKDQKEELKEKQKEKIYCMVTKPAGGTICSKLYKTFLAQKLEMQPIRIGEDLLFNIQYLKLCNQVSQINYAGYNYYHNQESATQKYIKNILPDLEKILNHQDLEDENIVFYTYRLYNEYIYTEFHHAPKENFYACIKAISDHPCTQKCLQSVRTKKAILQKVAWKKRLYTKCISYLFSKKQYHLIYCLEKIKLNVKG